MKTLRFDSVGGASGDMILASLVALGVAPEALRAAVATMGLDPFEIRAEPASDRGLAGIRVDVPVHAHDHGDPGHDHPPHRALQDILGLIRRSSLPDPVQQLSATVFERLADAEARVHGTTPDRIHFHEVGAMDSIVDIVGSCLALHLLGVGRVELGPLPMGHGTITCAHGVLPNPAPATADLLKGFPVVSVDEPYELVTPTAAALLATWTGVLREPAAGPAVMAGVGCAVGHRRLNGRANVLRACLLESAAGLAAGSDVCLVLECNLDDMVPELIGSLSQQLLDQGALDVFTTPVQMKKQRPGTLLTVLCHPDTRETMLDLLFTGSTTLGVREHETRRTVLGRRHVTVETPYGPVRVKIGSWKGRDVTRAPEHDDCARVARDRGVPVRAVYDAALAAAGR